MNFLDTSICRVVYHEGNYVDRQLKYINYMIPSLQALQTQERKKILLDIADALEANESLIMVENEADVAAAQEAGYEKSLISRLALKPGKASTYILRSRVLFL
jgi:gamma-glutamyl phosphate reductase